jgi:hypothetical protein
MKKLGIISGLLFILGCHQSVQDRIIRYVEKYCMKAQDTCIVKLNNLVPFEWDTMYIFGANANNDFITGTVRFPYQGTVIQPGHRKIIFTYGHHIVYEEVCNSLDHCQSIIDFSSVKDSILSLRGYSFYLNDAVFSAYREKFESGCTDCYIYHLLTISMN